VTDRRKPETILAGAVRGVLEAKGVPFERVQSGQLRVKRGRLHCASKGTPDYWSALGWIECKVPGGKLSPEQEAWHAEAKRWGVRVAVVTSGAETAEVLDRWLSAREYELSMGWRTGT
jgi:hypothetical protein